MAGMGKGPLAGALLLAAATCAASAVEELARAPVLAVPPMPRPDYLETVTDPVFGTPFTRVTDPGRPLAPGIACRPAYCRHRYFSIQAWNADQSLLAITNGCHGLCFLDGHTYRPVFRRAIADEDCKWHPTDAALMICVSPTQIYTWAPQSNQKTIAYAPPEYGNLQFGPGKGNPSRDGTRLVVRATNRAGAQVAFAYDLAARAKYPDIELVNLPGRNRSCGISPSGHYIACFQKSADGIEDAFFFTLDGAHVQHWPEHHRPDHGDMMIDADGSDVYVGISKSAPDKWHVIKRRIKDGLVTDLAPSGFGAHASVRNGKRPGWVFVSYEGAYSKVAGDRRRAPFYQEVVAIRTDGSGIIRRIAQTRNLRHDYQSETHASPSPDGSQVIWTSNWGEPGGPVADYVSRLSWPDAEEARR